MMKKMMTLVMVLAMASLASAGVIYQLEGGSVVTEGITWTIENNQLLGTGTAAGLYDLYLVTPGQDSIIADLTFSGHAGNNAGLTDFGDGWYSVYAQDIAGAGQTTGSVWFTFDVLDEGIVETWVAAGAEAGPNLVIVPEPMTLGLLGLGGLFLRRRK